VYISNVECLKGSTPVELTVPLHYEGQLTLRIDDGSPDELMMPVHPLEPIRSLSLRLEKAVYHANEAGNPLTSPAMMDSMVHPIVNFFFIYIYLFPKHHQFPFGSPVWITTDE